MQQRIHRWTISALLALTATPTWAGLETVIGGVSQTGRGHVSVQVRMLNLGSAPMQVASPPRLQAGLSFGGRTLPMVLDRTDGPGPATVVGGTFITTRFEGSLPDDLPADAAVVLSLPGGSSFAFRNVPSVSATPSDPAPAVVEHSLSPPRADTGNAFLGNLSAYDPIYAVYGPGTDSDAKIQISFKYQLFGSSSVLERPWEAGLHFAYTQRLYWNLGRKSSPFRNVDYMPELVYIVPPQPISSDSALGGKIGVRHESNGRDGIASRSLNTVYIQPVANVPIGKYRLSIGPRLWAFVGDLSDNADVRRYRGNTGLFAEFGTDDGLRITTNSRFNLGSGKGSIDATASYPLNRLLPQLNLYVFGQGFAGYGENLLDYDRRQTRLRLGIGIVR